VDPAAKARSHDVRSEAQVTVEVARTAILAMLADRGSGSTICPSEVARKIAAEASADDTADWRTMMPIVHAAVDHLLDQENISLRWKGRALKPRSGPYRIARTDAD